MIPRPPYPCKLDRRMRHHCGRSTGRSSAQSALNGYDACCRKAILVNLGLWALATGRGSLVCAVEVAIRLESLRLA